MSLKTNFLIIFLGLSSLLFAQKEGERQIQIHDFSGTLAFLSSGWMEGREAGTRGSFMAADYIASLMELHGLKPWGDPIKDPGRVDPDKKKGTTEKRLYFQDFNIYRCKTVKSSLSVISKSGTSETELFLKPETEFRTHDTRNSSRARAEVVFAGYGLNIPGLKYEDYKNLDVKGKIVMVLAGYPGHRDTTSPAGIKLNRADRERLQNIYYKIKMARDKGAVALIELEYSSHPACFRVKPANEVLLNQAMNSVKPADPEYTDDNYRLASDTLMADIPVFSLSSLTTSELVDKAGIDLASFEKQAAERMIAMPEFKSSLFIGYSAEVVQEPVLVRNVIGMIPGADTTKSIVIGAHYDHLGTRNGSIYFGSDDNASGVAGMLALAGYWSGIHEKPAVNLVFAAWTAEEKGILGSSWFVENRITDKNQVLLYINFDMISRSAPEDTLQNIVSAGTLKSSEDLRKITETANRRLDKPFKLDLWEASENGGSDYVPFAAEKIPIMTFFSGFHDDYHSPRDVFQKADLKKMLAMINLANNCMKEVLYPKK